jgi:hypothetical protein
MPAAVRPEKSQVASRPFELIGELSQLLPLLAAKGATTHLAEPAAERRLIVVRHHSIGHLEQDVVLFENMMSQQLDVLAGRRVKLAFGQGFTGTPRNQRCGHLTREFASLPVLVQHDTDGPSLAGNAPSLNQGEQQVFLFGMMASISEQLKKLHALGQCLIIKAAAVLGPVYQALEHGNDS